MHHEGVSVQLIHPQLALDSFGAIPIFNRVHTWAVGTYTSDRKFQHGSSDLSTSGRLLVTSTLGHFNYMRLEHGPSVTMKPSGREAYEQPDSPLQLSNTRACCLQSASGFTHQGLQRKTSPKLPKNRHLGPKVMYRSPWTQHSS